MEECVNEIVVCVKRTVEDGVVMNKELVKTHEKVLRTMAPSIFDDDDGLCDAFGQLTC